MKGNPVLPAPKLTDLYCKHRCQLLDSLPAVTIPMGMHALDMLESFSLKGSPVISRSKVDGFAL